MSRRSPNARQFGVDHAPVEPGTCRPIRRARRRAQRGFTLTELSVALVAGLVIAVAVVGLSREANNTFHEEMRTAAAESSLRTALDRLRADLQRASFMSTANITRDPQIAAQPGQPHVSVAVASSWAKLASLAGIQINVGGSATATPLSAAQSPKLNPDSIDIAGNMTSTDQFMVLQIDTSPTGCGQRLWLQTDSPAMWRILATQYNTDGGTAGSADQALANAFQPVAGQKSIIRLQDQKGMYQYLVTCDQASGGASQGVPQPYIDIDKTTPIITSKDTAGFGGADGLCNGCMVNPVQIVRWELKPSGVAALNPSGDPNKYDLVRSFVKLSDGTTLPTSSEVISEYAVDLKFALTVDSSTTTDGLVGALTTLALDDDTNNKQWSADVSTLPQYGFAFANGSTAPQRIRAVRVRLATRASIIDRSTNVPVPTPNPAPAITQRFMFRYCAGQITTGEGGAQSLPDCTQPGQIWARARTVVTEVWLTNQGGFFYL
jgi:prepilin-type N-terminal cleavage/methylation domain-containing protein